MNHIDFRAYDTHEHGPTIEQRITEARVDLQLAQRIRDGLQKKQEAEAFEQAEKRFRRQS